MNTKTVGERTEAKVLSALVHIYPSVLIPFGENQRYDFVFEDLEGEFKRVQCKTGVYKNGAIVFRASNSVTVKGVIEQRDYQKDVDFFGVSCSGSPDVYLIPIERVGINQCNLRIDPPKRNVSNIVWAKEFLI